MAGGRLDNKVIVVVGATTGIGLSAARAFVSEGAKVVGFGRNPDSVRRAQEVLGGNARLFAADAAEPESAERAIQEAVSRFGGFHGLYHVAGGSGRRMGDGPLDRITDEGWRATIDLNLTSLFYSNRAAIRRFLAQESGGSILNLGSVLGFSPSPEYFGTHAYAAAKAAIIGLTRASAAYYAPRGVRFNVLAPGLVDTPMAQRAAQDAAIMEYVSAKQPLDGGRIGQPEDLDSAAVYFLSDESRFVTGQVLGVDGGWTVSEGRVPRE